MKTLRITIAVAISFVCFAFNTIGKPVQEDCSRQLYWFTVGGSPTTLVTVAMVQIIPVPTTCLDVNPNEVVFGTRPQVLATVYVNCAINETYYCALGYTAAQLEVREIPAGSGNCFWIPKLGELPKCAIKKADDQG